MATANQFQITLSFKAVMDGLNQYVNAYKNRMAEVEAFNRRITNGGAALQTMLGQVGAVLGGAALIKYAKDAAEADRVQQQLIRTLQRVGETGALEALNAQATALQRVTHFTDEAVSNVQRLLLNAGLSARQTQDLTEQVLDFAQETGQAAESAAALIARTLRGQTDELGRYNIKLDTSKGKVDALREALGRYASGAARGAVADAQARENTARFADATENLGRAVNRLIVPLQGQLIPLLEWLTRVSGTLADALAPLAPVIGEILRVVLGAVIAFGSFKLVTSGVLLLLNPLRTAFVLLAGESLLSLSNRLAVVSARFGDMTTASVLLKDGLTSLAGAGRAAAIGLSIAGAAVVGWELGKMINEIQVGGMAIKDWVSIAIVWVGDKLAMVLDGLRVAWVVTKSAGEAFWDALKLHTLSGVIAILAAWNKLPFGQKLEVDLAPLRAEFDATAAHIAGAGARLLGDLDAISAAQAKRKKENDDLIRFMKEGGSSSAFGPGTGAKPGLAPAAASGRKDLNGETFGIDQAEMFRLQTQLLQAQLAGNQAEVDRITDLLEEKKLKQELLQLEGEAGPLVAARIKAQVDARAKDRKQTVDELSFQQQLGNLEIRRADIEANRLLSEQEKQRQLNALLDEENRLIAAKLALDEKQLQLGVTDQEKGRLLQEIAQLRKQLAENQRTKESTRELTVSEGVQQGGAGFLSSLATSAQNAADAVQGTLNNALTNTSDLLYNLASGAMNFRQAWGTAILNVGQNFLRMTTDMVAKMLWRATVEKGLTALSVMLHLGGEGAKTAGTAAGVGTRMALKIKEVLADVYHGAVAAFKALAGIPIVGPVLGAAALAGALALGFGLVSRIGHADGAIIRGPGGPRDDLIPAMLSNGEAVTKASVVSQFGEGFFQQLNNGVLDLSAVPGGVARQMALSGSAGSSPSSGGGPAGTGRDRRIIVMAPDLVSARQMARDPEFENVVVDVMRRRRGDILES